MSRINPLSYLFRLFGKDLPEEEPPEGPPQGPQPSKGKKPISDVVQQSQSAKSQAGAHLVALANPPVRGLSPCCRVLRV